LLEIPRHFAFLKKGKMPPLFYKRGIKDKDTVLSLRGALATKQSRFYKKAELKGEKPAIE